MLVSNAADAASIVTMMASQEVMISYRIVIMAIEGATTPAAEIETGVLSSAPMLMMDNERKN